MQCSNHCRLAHQHSGYSQRQYQLRGKAITGIGANFNTKTRSIDKWETDEDKENASQ